MTNYLTMIKVIPGTGTFNFGQISEFKRGVAPIKKIESKCLVNVHIYKV